MLGSGTPRPDPDRSGPATAIVVNGTPYLVDFGPGVIRRAAAAYQKGVTAFGVGVANLATAFLTHLHSDHTMGYPDLIFTPWLMGRREPLLVYGPKGLKAMTENILQAWEVDLGVRTIGGHARPPCEVKAHEITSGDVYGTRNITVTAFPVHHGDDLDAFGFRFETPDRTIVLSGDTSPTRSLVDHCDGCDILIHEAYPLVGDDVHVAGVAAVPPHPSHLVETIGRYREPVKPRPARRLSPLEWPGRANELGVCRCAARRNTAELRGPRRGEPRSGRVLMRENVRTP